MCSIFTHQPIFFRRLVHLQHHHLQKDEDARYSNSSGYVSTQPLVAKKVALSLQVVDGNVLDSSPIFPKQAPTKTGSIAEIGLQCLKFYNCEMYYTDQQLVWLEEGLKTASLPDRLLFFQESLRFRSFFFFFHLQRLTITTGSDEGKGTCGQTPLLLDSSVQRRNGTC